MTQIKLKGFNGFAAYQSYIAAIHFLRFCDTYITLGRSREAGAMTQAECLEHFKEQDEATRCGILLELLSIAELDDKDISRLLSVHTDSNNVPIGKHKIVNMPPSEIAELAFKTMLACADLSDSLFFYQPTK